MKPSLQHALDALRNDHESVTGGPFTNFFCPILYRDDDVELCEGHIVNRALSDSPPDRTVQRKDVDNFYGSMFEADWVIIQERGKHTITDVLADKSKSWKLRPQIWRDGRAVQHYVGSDVIPPDHTPIVVEGTAAPIWLVLKIDPSLVLDNPDSHWEISIARDLRLAALVSLLKAAHLTLFRLMGYRYVYSPSGDYLGYDVLGKFFLDSNGLSKPRVLERARTHFAEHVSIVRPVLNSVSQGSLTDRLFLLCMPDMQLIWGMMVFIRLADTVHGVLVPTFQDGETAARYLRFVKAPFPRFETRVARFEGTQWAVANRSSTVTWPPSDLE